MENSLFRYRSVSDYSIEELIYDQIVGTTNDLLNDPYDCRFFYNETECVSFLNSHKNILNAYILYNDLQRFSDNEVVRYAARKLVELVSKTFLTVCFSKTYDKEIMWSHYAKNGTGFVIEYDAYEILKFIKSIKADDYIKRHTAIHRVNYTSERTNNTEFLKKLFCVECGQDEHEYNFNEFPLYKFNEEDIKTIVAEKNIDWSYEEEFRLITPNVMKNDRGELISCHEIIINDIKPKAIYIGENCSKKDKLLLCSIARTKNIKIYKMSSHNNKNYRLKAELINEYEIDDIIDRHILETRDRYVYALKKVANDFGENKNN